MAITYKKSKSGYYKVELVKTFTHADYTYKPSHSLVVVNEEILAEMIKADVVATVVSAD